MVAEVAGEGQPGRIESLAVGCNNSRERDVERGKPCEVRVWGSRDRAAENMSRVFREVVGDKTMLASLSY